MSQGLRARDLGLPFSGTPGTSNALTDVPGVLVGNATIVEGDGPLVAGRGPVRTGVTAILPSGRGTELAPVWAGFHAFNGNGEMTGTHWINDAGYLVGPICITNTHSVGMVHHAATKWMIRTYPAFHEHHVWAMPVVAETYDGLLNDINGQHVREEHVLHALDTASDGPVPEGNVGGGTGMICYEFKGGTGTSSRQTVIEGTTYTVGALVQANHGQRDWLTILGVPVGKHLLEGRISWTEQGSIIVVIGTDLPLLPPQLTRLAKRASIGIGRHGTPGGNNSGDIFLAFSTANRGPLHQFAPSFLSLRCVNDEKLNDIYRAAVEAIEEAVVNALVAARDTPTLRPPGKICRAIPHDRLVEVMRAYNRCA